MKVKELLGKFLDSYMEIAINEYSGSDHTGRRWILPRHQTSRYLDLPEEIKNAEVTAIVPYYDRISIEIEASKG